MREMTATHDSRMRSIGYCVPTAPLPGRFIKSDAERAASREDHWESMRINAALRHYSKERAAQAAADCY